MCSESSEPLAGRLGAPGTAKASRISQTVKSRCAREWGGWGRLSDDGPGHYNPDPSEGPWGRWSIPPHGGAVSRRPIRLLGGSTLKHEGRRQTDRRAAYAGSRLKLIDASGRSRLIRQPFSRNGENSPYGMLGGIVETSASFEARSAPRSYPTNCHERRPLDYSAVAASAGPFQQVT
jgi:hypothetical protein